jgi:ubiquinone/menaquinone biosynthesis C-methylase UbiE
VDADPKQACRQFFDTINTQLDQTMFGEFSYFLNFGYIPDDNPQLAAVTLPERAVNRNSAKLVLEVIGNCPLDQKRVLDVGCGRGGTATVVNQFFTPHRFTGMDLSGNAVAFCARTHRYPGFRFIQGDAEKLPVRTGSINAVINIESSQSYPDIRAFYCEVFRVLAEGGHFLYTDVRPVRQMAEWTGLLQTIGFTVEADRDITSNVLLSCEDVAKQRKNAYASGSTQSVMDNFLGAPGSQVYEEMKSRRWSYRILKLRKAR